MTNPTLLSDLTMTHKPLQYGDFVVTSDMTRGFVVHYRSTGSVSVMFPDELGRRIETWPVSLLDLSGVEPTGEQCAEFARWTLR